MSGPVNVVCPGGHATTRSVLDAAVAATGRNAELVWVDPAVIRAAGIDRWTELPGWIPPDPQYAGLRSTNVDRATAAGLRCRPVERTVADTWAWLSTTGGHQTPGPGHPALGMDPAKERSVLDSWRHLCAGPAG